jgi:hypothetical protein
MLALHVVVWQTANMKSNPMLEEVWRVGDEWARAGNEDTHHLCHSACHWAEGHPQLVPAAHRGQELRRRATQLGGLKFGRNVVVKH